MKRLKREDVRDWLVLVVLCAAFTALIWSQCQPHLPPGALP